jgi:hypothetical protein
MLTYADFGPHTLSDPKVIDPNFVASGTQCKNNGCTLVYENDSSLQASLSLSLSLFLSL